MGALILTRGIPASGKSTWAKEYVREDPTTRIRVNRDDIRRMLYATTDRMLDHQQEKVVSIVEKAIAKEALAAGKTVVIDAMNLRARWVKDWLELGYPVEFQDFPVALAVALDRNARRMFPIPSDAIERIYGRLTRNGALPAPPELAEPAVEPDPYEPDWELPTAVVVDIDGTLAHNNSGRSFYDMDRVGEDDVDDSVRAFVNSLNAEHQVIIVSGRDKSALHATQLWLQDNSISHDYLYMREIGDDRPDTVIKRELFDRHIRDRFNVLGVIDDRPSVCRCWRAMGVKTFQVGDPTNEF